METMGFSVLVKALTCRRFCSPYPCQFDTFWSFLLMLNSTKFKRENITFAILLVINFLNSADLILMHINEAALGDELHDR